MRNQTKAVRAAVLAAALLGAGCYKYEPLKVPEAESGQTVRAFLTPDRAVELQETAGIQGRWVTGRVVSADDREIMLEIPSATVSAGGMSRRLRQRVALPSDQLLDLQARSVDTWKTGLVAGAVAAAAVGLVVYQFSQDENAPVRDPKNPPDQMRIPLLRIPLRP